MRRHGTRLVFLWRRNSLRQLLSNLVNKATDGLAHPTGAAVAATRGVRVDVPVGAKLMRHLRDIELKRKRVHGYYREANATTVHYEDVIAASPKFASTWRRVAAFLGVAPFAFPRTAAGVIHQGAPILAPAANAGAVRDTLYAACASHARNASHAHVSADVLAICDELRRDERRTRHTNAAGGDTPR